jgi:hypothetical protein
LTEAHNRHTFDVEIVVAIPRADDMNKDYRDVLEGRSFLLSTGQWQTTVVDVKPFRGVPPPWGPVTEETLVHDWLFFQLKFTNEAHTELGLKLYVCVHLPFVDSYGYVDPRLHQEIALWLGNPERGTELTIGPYGRI